jgi:hypothetical protein
MLFYAVILWINLIFKLIIACKNMWPITLVILENCIWNFSNIISNTCKITSDII